MSAIAPAAQTLSAAAVLLDGRSVLRPGTRSFEQFYVPRSHIEPKRLDSKAVVFYPNGEGWYAVHPAVKGML